MKLSVKLLEVDNEFIASCPELEINCYGSDKTEAIIRIQKVLKFYVDSAKEFGLDVDNLEEISIDGVPAEHIELESCMPASSSIN